MSEYARRDIRTLDRQGNHYTRHMSAMTEETLMGKSAIAAELAWRDAQIVRLKAHVERLRQAGNRVIHYGCEKCEWDDAVVAELNRQAEETP